MGFDLLSSTYYSLRDGGRLRYARFEPSVKARGTVLIVPGRREFIEKKFFELGPQLLEQAYRLIIVELRGQGLSTRYLEGEKHQCDHISDFTLSLNDLRAFYADVVAPDMTAPLIAHGHSLGGHYLLRWLAEDTPPAAGAFLTAPMLALTASPIQLTAHGLSWIGVRLLDHATDYAPSQGPYGATEKQFVNNPLTQDAERFAMIENYFTAHPELTVGGVSWGWVLAALRSMDITHGRHYLDRIGIPVLAVTGSEDRVTPAREISRYLNYIPQVQTSVIEGARHDVLNETDTLRQQAWDKINPFLASVTN